MLPETPEQAFKVTVGVWSFHTTGPAPVDVAPAAVHVIAASFFVCRDPAAWTPGDWVDRLPRLECQTALVLAAALVPLVAAFEAHGLPTLAGRLVPTPAGLANRQPAVRPRTPLEVPVFADAHVFFNNSESLCHFIGAEQLHMTLCELLFALGDHARNLDCLAGLDSRRQMVSSAVLAESVTAVECEEVGRSVHLIARFACLTV